MTISSLIPPLPPLNFNNNNESKQQSTSRIPLSPKNSIHSNKIITTTTKTSNSNSNSNPNSIPSTSAAGVRFEGINGRTVESEQEEIEQEQQEEEEDVELTIENQSQVGVTGGGEDISMIVVDSDDESNSIRNTLDENLTPLHVEVRLLTTSTMRYDLIRRMIFEHLHSEYDTLLTHSEVNDWKEHSTLVKHVDRVWIAECSLPSTAVPLHQVSLQIHVYQPSDSPYPFPLTSTSSSNTNNNNTTNSDEDSSDSDVPAASILELPSSSLEGIWDSLIYDGDIKGNLLNYIYSTMLFSDAMVDFNIVTWNRVVLLHGPPGTGKTSLCKALAQKLAIRLSNRYEHGKLIEINSHSLFSKWFSESGKLVQKLFAAVTEMVDDESGFVVVLIDEVESLTAARAGAMSGKEPSDALRVVNALLTQLDKLKHRKNCLVMTTSNLSGAIDGAFIDRADIKQFIGLPPAQAVYWILQSCLTEIMRAGLIAPVKLLDWNSITSFKSTGSKITDKNQNCSLLLYDLSHSCQGMSGRTLRRLPVLAHAKFIGMNNSSEMEIWLEAMKKCVVEEGKQMGLVDRPIE